MLEPGDPAMATLNWKSMLPAGHFGILVPKNPQAKSGVPLPAGKTVTVRDKLAGSWAREVGSMSGQRTCPLIRSRPTNGVA